MATIHPEKKVDIPPRGDRNADPITNAPGAHPVEAGVGAAVAGAAAGMAVGAVTGPVGAAVGAAVGAVAGGLAGKSVGEMIDPTTEDNWLRENYRTRPYYREEDSFDSHLPAYRYGAEAESVYGEQSFDAVETRLADDWNARNRSGIGWERAREPARDAYDRCCTLRQQRTVRR